VSARRESIETVIVGGGQAGLALSYFPGQLGREHVVLERGRVAERWRSERWDSLTLLAPNWTAPMPGHAFPGDRDVFASRDEVVRFLDGYASTIRAPVRCGVGVTALRAKPGTERLVVETDHASLEAVNVVVATGPFQEPILPAFAASLPPELVQVTSSRYTNPAQLPPGPVLVVGSATSGCQIVEDLQGAGRRVYLSVGSHRRAVRRYRGRDISTWAYPALIEVTVDSLPSPEARRRPGLLWTGVNGGHDIDLRRYAREGVVLLGHLQGYEDEKLFLAADLEENLAKGDEALAALLKVCDEYIRKMGIDAPEEPPRDPGRPPPIPSDGTRELDLRGAGIVAVVWATGFRCDFRWIDLPIFDERGEPVHRRGVTTIPGLSFLGLQWLYKRKSSFFYGLEEDAAYLAEHIAARA
jgi:putative flavoprotein involved in K+ transport